MASSGARVHRPHKGALIYAWFFVKTVRSPFSVVAEAGFEPTFPGHEPGELAVTPFCNIEAWPPMSSGDAVFISPSAGGKGNKPVFLSRPSLGSTHYHAFHPTGIAPGRSGFASPPSRGLLRAWLIYSRKELHESVQWRCQQESNLQPAAYKAAALPIELRQHISFYFHPHRHSAILVPAPKLYTVRIRPIVSIAQTRLAVRTPYIPIFYQSFCGGFIIFSVHVSKQCPLVFLLPPILLRGSGICAECNIY